MAGLAGALALTTAMAASGGAARSAAAAAGPPWKIVPAPVLQGQVDLTDVTAFSRSDAWAVGYVADGYTIQTLTLHWDGTAWTRILSPDPGTERNWLTAVSGSSPADVWAAGSYASPDGTRRTMLMHWDGSQWAVAPSPSLDYESVLNGIAVLSPDDAWAVGSAGDVNFRGKTLIEHWNGAAWTAVPSPSPSKTGVGSNLLAVAGVSATDVWAVGDIDTGGNVMGTLTEHWDGRSWQAVASPTMPEGALLDRVAAGSSGAVWAVGWQQQGELTQPLAMHWTGTQWLTTPSFAHATGAFNGVGVLGPAEVWAVGDTGTGTLAARWDGTSWTITPSASPGPIGSTFTDLAVVPGTSCLWAVGSYIDNGSSSALIERHC